MKKNFIITLSIFVTSMLLFSLQGCDSGGGSGDGDGTGSYSTGDKVTVSFTAVTFKMVYVPGGLTFPTGLNDDGTATVANPYFIAETELTDELWEAVYDWATNAANDHDGDGTTGDDVYDFANPHYGFVPTDRFPVDSLNWRDCMVWSNALTEYSNANNGTNYSCVYYTDEAYTEPIRVSTNDDTDDDSDGVLDNSLVPGSEDSPYIKAETSGNTDMANCTGDGFRLLTSDEWELAARYVDGTTWNKGSHVSGDLTGYVISTTGTEESYSTVFDDYAVYKGNADDGVYKDWAPGYAVKSRDPNSLGIYDMSGSLFEWCFDWHYNNVGSKRIARGGDYRTLDYQLYLAMVLYNDPYDYNQDINLRIGRSAR